MLTKRIFFHLTYQYCRQIKNAPARFDFKLIILLDGIFYGSRVENNFDIEMIYYYYLFTLSFNDLLDENRIYLYNYKNVLRISQ